MTILSEILQFVLIKKDLWSGKKFLIPGNHLRKLAWTRQVAIRYASFSSSALIFGSEAGGVLRVWRKFSANHQKIYPRSSRDRHIVAALREAAEEVFAARQTPSDCEQ